MRVRRIALGIGLGITAIILVGWPDIIAFVNGARPDNVNALYAVRRAVTPGMPREALDRVASSAPMPIRTQRRSRDELLIWVSVGFMESVYLEVFLSNDVVAHARIRGDSGEFVPGAPADF